MNHNRLRVNGAGGNSCRSELGEDLVDGMASPASRDEAAEILLLRRQLVRLGAAAWGCLGAAGFTGRGSSAGPRYFFHTPEESPPVLVPAAELFAQRRSRWTQRSA